MKHLLLLVLLLQGCGTLNFMDKAVDYTTEVDNELQEHVDDFMLSCRFMGMNEICQTMYRKISSIKLVDDSEFDKKSTAGVCVIRSRMNGSFYDGRIMIKRSTYEKVKDTPNVANVLIFHEMGHCIAFLDHIDNRPHIMNPFIYYPLDTIDFQIRVQELFDTAKDKSSAKIMNLGDTDCVVRKVINE